MCLYFIILIVFRNFSDIFENFPDMYEIISGFYALSANLPKNTCKIQQKADILETRFIFKVFLIFS